MKRIVTILLTDNQRYIALPPSERTSERNERSYDADSTRSARGQDRAPRIGAVESTAVAPAPHVSTSRTKDASQSHDSGGVEAHHYSRIDAANDVERGQGPRPCPSREQSQSVH